jgi:hypothetical protein
MKLCERGRLFHNFRERLDELIYNSLLIILTFQVKNTFKFGQCSSCELEFRSIYNLSRLSAVPFCSCLCHDSTQTLCAVVHYSTN